MSPVADTQVARAMAVVASACAWVSDATAHGHDWTAHVDNALIDAVDAYQHPLAAAAGKMCLRDAAEEHADLLRGQYVCSRIATAAAEHNGSCRFEPVAQVIEKVGARH